MVSAPFSADFIDIWFESRDRRHTHFCQIVWIQVQEYDVTGDWNSASIADIGCRRYNSWANSDNNLILTIIIIKL